MLTSKKTTGCFADFDFLVNLASVKRFTGFISSIYLEDSRWSPLNFTWMWLRTVLLKIARWNFAHIPALNKQSLLSLVPVTLSSCTYGLFNCFKSFNFKHTIGSTIIASLSTPVMNGFSLGSSINFSQIFLNSVLERSINWERGGPNFLSSCCHGTKSYLNKRLWTHFVLILFFLWKEL